MKKYNQALIYILSSLIGILFIISYALYSRLSNLNKTLDQLYITNSEQDLRQINNLIFESHFKDDLVLSNFNISITIIIAFFTVLIALGAVFSFKRIDDDIDKLKIEGVKVEETAQQLKQTAKEIEKTKAKVERNQKNYLENLTDSTILKIGLTSNQLTVTLLEMETSKFNMSIIVGFLSTATFDLLQIGNLYYFSKNQDKTLKKGEEYLNNILTDTLKCITDKKHDITEKHFFLLQAYIESLLETMNFYLFPEIENTYNDILNFIKNNSVRE